MVVGGFTKRPDENCTNSIEMGAESIGDSIGIKSGILDIESAV